MNLIFKTLFLLAFICSPYLGVSQISCDTDSCSNSWSIQKKYTKYDLPSYGSDCKVQFIYKERWNCNSEKEVRIVDIVISGNCNCTNLHQFMEDVKKDFMNDKGITIMTSILPASCFALLNIKVPAMVLRDLGWYNEVLQNEPEPVYEGQDTFYWMQTFYNCDQSSCCIQKSELIGGDVIEETTIDEVGCEEPDPPVPGTYNLWGHTVETRPPSSGWECRPICQTGTFKRQTGMEPMKQNDDDIKVFPNPADNSIQLNIKDAPNGPLDITLYDQSGKTIKTLTENVTNKSLNKSIKVENLQKGVYILSIRGKSYNKTIKIIK